MNSPLDRQLEDYFEALADRVGSGSERPRIPADPSAANGQLRPDVDDGVFELNELPDRSGPLWTGRRVLVGAFGALLLLGAVGVVAAVARDAEPTVDVATTEPPSSNSSMPGQDLMLEPAPTPQPVDPAQAEILQQGLIEMLERGELTPSLLGPFVAGNAGATSFPGGGGNKSADVTAEGSGLRVSVSFGTMATVSSPAVLLTESEPIDPASLPPGILGATRETRRVDNGEVISANVVLTSESAPGFVLNVWTVGGGAPLDELLDLALRIYDQYPVTT